MKKSPKIGNFIVDKVRGDNRIWLIGDSVEFGIVERIDCKEAIRGKELRILVARLWLYYWRKHSEKRFN